MKLLANFTIIGKKPILFHSFSIDTISLKKGERSGVAGNSPDEWKRSVLKTKENQLYIDASYIFGCLRDGGRHIRQGKGTLQAKIASTLYILDDIVLLDRFLPPDENLSQDKAQLVYLDVRSVKNPATKGRNIRYRVAAGPGWRASCRIQWDGSVVSRGEMESALVNAGDLSGIGDGRAIGFGRFSVERFVVTSHDEKSPT